MKISNAKKFLACFMAMLTILTSLSVCMVYAADESDFTYKKETNWDTETIELLAPKVTTPSEPEEITTAPAGDKEFETGDANIDNKLNIRDATLIQKHLAKITTMSEAALELADFNKDSKVNVKDATSIQKFIAGIR